MLTSKKVGVQVNNLENPYETQLSKRIVHQHLLLQT